MAREYRPYTTGRQAKNRRLKMAMLALIVIIVGLVILIKTRPAEDPADAETTTPPRVALNDVLPPSRAAAESAQSRPRTPSVSPAPATAAPMPAAVEPAATVSETPPAADALPSAEPTPIQAVAAETVPAGAVPAAVAAEEVQDKTSVEAQQLIEKALRLRDAGNIIAARDLLNDALNMQLSPQVHAGVKVQMAKLSEKWLFSRDVIQGDKLTGYYLVQPGDLLAKVGKEHKVPYEILMSLNDISRPELLRAGRRIKVIHGPFNAVVNRSTYTMDLYLQNVYVKSYKVGLGKPEHTTPTGRWIAAPGGKMISPTWTDPDTGKTYHGSDPDYPLGSRWIGLDGIEGDAKGRTGFALHGTKEPETIGTQSSRGCIRLHNGDVVEVYNLLEPGQSGVVVTD